MSSRILCISCGIWLRYMKKYTVLEQNTKVVSIISERIFPNIITENDYVCQTCLNAITENVNQNTQKEISSSDKQVMENSHTQVFGHRKVCLMCGCSVLRRRSNLILHKDPSDLQQRIANTILNSTAVPKLTMNDRVCHPCWMRAKKTALDLQQAESEECEIKIKIEITESLTEMEPLERADLVPEQRSLDSTEEMNVGETVEPRKRVSPTSSDSEWLPKTKNVTASKSPVPNITLENYRRAANTGSRCVFSPCTNQNLCRVSDALRKKIIADHRFYLPCHVKVCAKHLLANRWDTLYNSERSIAVFTSEQIEHIFSLVNSNSCNIDFDDPLNVDDNVFQYCLGLTKEKFKDILKDIPQIQATHRGVTGLAAHLIKLSTGESNERIASLMGIPRRTLEGIMKNIKEILKDLSHQINLLPDEQAD